MSKDDKKNSKNNNVILLKSIKEEKEKILKLNDKENELKEKLQIIEKKLISMEKVMLSLDKDNSNTIFNSDAFNMLVGSIAIAAAVNTIAEYFGISPKEIDKLID